MSYTQTLPVAATDGSLPTPGVRHRIGFASAALGHALLGPLLELHGMIATLHAVVTILFVIGWAFVSPDLARIVQGAAYVAACDVLWRMTEAKVFWEAGKYAMAAALVVAAVRFLPDLRGSGLPLAYLALLLPSVLLTVSQLGLGEGREQLSLNLSGPLSLTVAAVFLGRIRMRWSDLRRVLVCLILPTIAIAGISLQATLTAIDIDFGSSSNRVTSGGFGPNQVSAALSLGAFVCLVLFLRERRPATRLFAAALGLWLFGQSVLTFSRGGAFNLAIAGGLLMVVLLFESGDQVRRVLALVILVGGGSIVFTQLDAFTGGALEERFADQSTTNRGELASSDYKIFREHLTVGVGPGMARFYRENPRLVGAAPHTEFTRLLSEHGLLGAGAAVILIVLIVQAVVRARSRWDQALTLALAGWAVAEMGHAAMRLAVVSFVLGIALARTNDGYGGASQDHESGRGVATEGALRA